MKAALHFVCSLEFWRMALFWTIALILSYLQLLKRRVFSPRTGSPSCRIRSSTGSLRPICVITGATSGIGKAAAFALSREGFYVVLVGRSSHSASQTLSEIKNQNKDAHLKAFEVDMSSFPSILKFRNSLQQWLSDSNMHPSIQLLVNNAGILAMSSRLTTEGYDEMIATNYIGAFFFTKLLLPLLKTSPVPARVVNVTSFTHRYAFAKRFDKETVTGVSFLRSKQYPCAQIYEYSKLCLLLFTCELHRQLRLTDDSLHISVVAADPGSVKTNIMREVPRHLALMAFCILKLVRMLQSPEDGVKSIIDAALAPPGTSGRYFFGGNGRTIDSSVISRDPKLAEELWNTSCDILHDSQFAAKETNA
ncbi:PREDICTED: short-chain dehydrogenase TIC 32, chloroplastic [Tarenaya hassleriana]|uniref:short-chain dehydrogenase TIC 32, chloroplastic n=1 Tax=Tarenaya hassleriana TaxID=28532 RepID=UPI00053C0EF0|nr:PREDICTED: short-chain dehydrogenase TIC 32, chloroplastic [Tarenaya hassleriana]XP_010543516.1 PREDICTED: short-chain dehydrogenase TIC 32, chloroplastic [Tarenaya hassleriana]XP_010543519.1 PREDICTED: short-chain dehydrogenase TIC 32, chloroplastic [Tarenaya hassleriana]